MISTVTTTTVSTVTTTTVGMAAALGVIAILTLITFLVAKELANADGRPRLQLASRVLNIAIVPLLMVFLAIVVARVVEALEAPL